MFQPPYLGDWKSPLDCLKVFVEAPQELRVHLMGILHKPLNAGHVNVLRSIVTHAIGTTLLLLGDATRGCEVCLRLPHTNAGVRVSL